MDGRLTVDETNICLKRWRELQDKEAYELLIKCNTGLVIFIAKKYLYCGLNFDELVSAGNLGLLNAINKFNYREYNINAFSTYIGTVINNTIIKEINNYNKNRNVLSFNEPLSNFDTNDEFIIEETISTGEKLPEDIAIENIRNNELNDVLLKLTEKEREIIILRFGLGTGNFKTLEEIAQIKNSTISKIAEEERKVLRKIRHPKYSNKIRGYID